MVFFSHDVDGDVTVAIAGMFKTSVFFKVPVDGRSGLRGRSSRLDITIKASRFVSINFTRLSFRNPVINTRINAKSIRNRSSNHTLVSKSVVTSHLSNGIVVEITNVYLLFIEFFPGVMGTVI